MLVLAGKPGRLNPNRSENKLANSGQKGEIATKLIMPREILLWIPQKLPHVSMSNSTVLHCLNSFWGFSRCYYNLNCDCREDGFGSSIISDTMIWGLAMCIISKIAYSAF